MVLVLFSEMAVNLNWGIISLIFVQTQISGFCVQLILHWKQMLWPLKLTDIYEWYACLDLYVKIIMPYHAIQYHITAWFCS